MFSARRTAQIGLCAALVMFVAGLAVLYVRSRHTPSQMMMLAGRVVPPIEFSDLSGARVDMSAFRGHVTVVYFTSTRCAASNVYAKRVAELSKKLSAGADPVRFVAVHRIDDLTDAPAIREIRVQASVIDQPFPTLLDPHGAAAATLGVERTPTFLIFGPTGKLRYNGPFDDSADAGKVTQHYVADAVEVLVRRTKLSVASTTPPASSW